MKTCFNRFISLTFVAASFAVVHAKTVDVQRSFLYGSGPELKKRAKTYSVTFTVGSCQITGTIAFWTSSEDHSNHCFVSYSNSCGGGGTVQLYRTTNQQGEIIVDRSRHITFSYDDRATELLFINNNGEELSITAINEVFKNVDPQDL